MNESANQPSPLQEWLAAHRGKVNAISEAVDELIRHLGHLPDPRSAEDVKALLRFRQAQFQVGDHSITTSARQRIAESAVEFIVTIKHRLKNAIEQLLENVEMVLAFDARHNRFGLFAPDLLPRESIVMSGDSAMLVHRFVLPDDHPLRTIEHDFSVFPTLYVCETSQGYRADGTRVAVLPRWATLTSVRRHAEETRARYDREQREAAELDRRNAEQMQRQRRLQMSREDLLAERVERLEKQLASQQEKDAAHVLST